MGIVESQYAVDRVGTIFKTDCEKCCCATRYYRMSQSTRRDQWSYFALGAMHAHNRFRRKHGCEPLTLNMRMCKMASGHARFLADNEIFEHSENEERRHSDGFCGENLAESLVWHDDYKRPSGEEVSLLWYNEGKDYKFKTGKFEPDCAQFTQMIWKKTKTFGIAYAEYEPSDANGFVKTVIVANYYPCGNLEGKFKDNVIEADVTSVLGDRDSKLQKKLNQYQRKKKRQANQARLLGRGSKDEGPGNLGFGTI